MNRLIAICIGATSLCGCHTRPEPVLETVDIHRAIDIRQETVSVAIPVAVMQRTSLDSVSLLTTPLAHSEARINPDGTLYHSLQHLDTAITAIAPHSTVYTESRQVIEHKLADTAPRSATRWLWPLILLTSAILYLKQRLCK